MSSKDSAASSAGDCPGLANAVVGLQGMVVRRLGADAGAGGKSVRIGRVAEFRSFVARRHAGLTGGLAELRQEADLLVWTVVSAGTLAGQSADSVLGGTERCVDALLAGYEEVRGARIAPELEWVRSDLANAYGDALYEVAEWLNRLCEALLSFKGGCGDADLADCRFEPEEDFYLDAVADWLASVEVADDHAAPYAAVASPEASSREASASRFGPGSSSYRSEAAGGAGGRVRRPGGRSAGSRPSAGSRSAGRSLGRAADTWALAVDPTLEMGLYAALENPLDGPEPPRREPRFVSGPPPSRSGWRTAARWVWLPIKGVLLLGWWGVKAVFWCVVAVLMFISAPFYFHHHHHHDEGDETADFY